MGDVTSIFDPGQTQFDDVDSAATTASYGDYLSRMETDLAEMKRGLHDLLEVGAGDLVLDVGCGIGGDVRALAERVGPTGRVFGIDNSQALVDQARAHQANRRLPVEFHVADAHQMPFPEAAFDASRGERIMMHVPDPVQVLREMVRVTRPGGRVLVADPDHGMWAPDVRNRTLARTVLHWWFDQITNPWIARQQLANFVDAGLRDVTTLARPIVLRTLDAATAMTGIAYAARAAADAGVISAKERDEFDSELRTADAESRFFMCGVIIVTLGSKPSR